ncbi:MAG: hypothetical protein D4S01_05825 [Dehalococcoidia bacterium]|nr:MAG: hypothetical protein D4S01_05825 [Dehalococcoidia bacterium]
MVHVDQYFCVLPGSNLELVDKTLDKNGINFVARTSRNNGVVARIKKLPNIEPNPANTISVAVSGSVMESFLQKEPYYSSYHLFVLKPKIALTDRQLLYYCMCLKANNYKYNYGRQADKTLHLLNIPSIEEIPAWVDKIPMPTVPKSSSVIKENIKLDTDNWRQFIFDDLFKIVRGESEYKVNMQKGDVPYVSATEKNNGVSYFVGNSNSEGNVITLSYDGTIGEAFYQKKKFFASEKIAVLDLKSRTLNPSLAMFLITIIRLEKFRFNYGYKWSIETRMKKTQIKLPSDNAGNPNWQFMEDYIKSLPFSSNL